jgi:hypothetical protein
MGGPRDATAAVQRTLPGLVETLAEVGVVVPESGRVDSPGGGFSHQPLEAGPIAGWAALRSELDAAPGDSALLVIPGLVRIGSAATHRLAMLAELSALAGDVFLVSVVGDQLTLLNDLYLQQVASWRMSKRLAGAVSRLLTNVLLDHETSLRPWYADNRARYAAVPMSGFMAENPVAAVLHAAGVDVPAGLPPATAAAPLRLGPIGVEANRLLSTYLRAEVADFRPDDPGIAAASRVALTRADRLDWCGNTFWGFTRRAAEKVLARYEVSNHRFARAVWGTDWTLPYPLERACTQVDFLDLDVKVIDQVHRFVLAMAEKVSHDLQVTP